jgi:cytoskeleton protein RodZ
MSESEAPAGPAIGVDTLAPTAGSMLKAAREKRGVHIAALSAAIKVPQRKLEALEGDRYDELPDLTFTRALAQSVCRSLKIDMQPVLDRLPAPGDMPRLARVGAGINAPFRDRPGRDEPTDWSWVRKPVVWGTLLVLVGAALLALLPESWIKSVLRSGATAPAASATATGPEAVSITPVVIAPADTAASSVAVPQEVPAAASAAAQLVPAPALAAAPAALALTASGDSWVEVQDARGQTLITRRLAAGEAVSLEGEPPLRVTIGNATATKLSFRGQPVDLNASTVGNVARIQLN